MTSKYPVPSCRSYLSNLSSPYITCSLFWMYFPFIIIFFRVNIYLLHTSYNRRLISYIHYTRVLSQHACIHGCIMTFLCSQSSSGRCFVSRYVSQSSCRSSSCTRRTWIKGDVPAMATASAFIFLMFFFFTLFFFHSENISTYIQDYILFSFFFKHSSFSLPINIYLCLNK